MTDSGGVQLIIHGLDAEHVSHLALGRRERVLFLPSLGRDIMHDQHNNSGVVLAVTALGVYRNGLTAMTSGLYLHAASHHTDLARPKTICYSIVWNPCQGR